MTADRFCQILAEGFEMASPPALDARLVEDLGFDSLHFLEVWLALDDLADGPIAPEAVTAAETVRDLYLLHLHVTDRPAT